MSQFVKMPEGVEVGVSVYLVSPSTSITAVVNLGGRTDITNFMASKWNELVAAAIETVNTAAKVTDMRVMTRDEIKLYQTIEDEEE